MQDNLRSGLRLGRASGSAVLKRRFPGLILPTRRGPKTNETARTVRNEEVFGANLFPELFYFQAISIQN